MLLGKTFKPVFAGPRERLTVIDEGDTYVWVQYHSGTKCPIAKSYLDEVYEEVMDVPVKGSVWCRRDLNPSRGARGVTVGLANEHYVVYTFNGADIGPRVRTLTNFHDNYRPFDNNFRLVEEGDE